MRAEILTIGDELCRGEIVDTNSSYLAARLWDLDITTRWMTSCNDDDGRSGRSARPRRSARADLVRVLGRAGPDRGRPDRRRRSPRWPAVDAGDRRARARADAGAVRPAGPAGPGADPPSESSSARSGCRRGARVHGNPAGLAPGFEVDAGRRARWSACPAFPREMHAILTRALGARLAELREAAGDVERIARRIYRVFGRGESQISQACRGAGRRRRRERRSTTRSSSPRRWSSWWCAIATGRPPRRGWPTLDARRRASGSAASSTATGEARRWSSA